MQREFHRLIGSQQYVIHTQIARSAAERLKKVTEFSLISGLQQPRLGELLAQTLESPKPCRIDEWKVLFCRINHL